MTSVYASNRTCEAELEEMKTSAMFTLWSIRSTPSRSARHIELGHITSGRTGSPWLPEANPAVAAQDQVLPHLAPMHLAPAVRHEQTRVLHCNADLVVASSLDSILILVGIVLAIVLVGVGVYGCYRFCRHRRDGSYEPTINAEHGA